MVRRFFAIIVIAALLVLVGACSKAEKNPNDSQGQAPSLCEKVQKYAKKAEGTEYVWGAESIKKGMDCSGFIYWIQMQIGHPVPRTTAKKYWFLASGNKKHWKQANCTDWVWWQFDPRRPYGHIGIMVENPKFWQSGSSSGVYSRKFFRGSFWNDKFKGTKSTKN